MHSFSVLAVAALALGVTATPSNDALVERVVPAQVYDSTSSKHNPRRVTAREKRLIGSRDGGVHRVPINTKSNSRTNSTTAAAAAAPVALNLNVTVSLNATSSRSYNSPFNLTQSYSGSTFMDGFDFFNYPDPTHGSVNYLGETEAKAAGLAYTTKNGTTILKVDDTTWLASGAYRNSVRLTSKKPFEIGSLVVLDAKALPYGPATWPAFWSVGTDWPNNGEIDIIEGVHDNTHNQYTLHTKPGCTLAQPMNATGTMLVENCDATLAGNLGCGILDKSNQTYGAPATAAGGAVYAMYWTKAGIKIWTFLRNEIPDDLAAGQPNFSNWGLPAAAWGSSTCDFSTNFGPQTIVFDITLCGDWAGATYNQAGFSGTCADAVANPTNFNNAFFEINYVKVYSLTS